MPTMYYDSTAHSPLNTRESRYATGGRVGLKKGGNGNWIQKVNSFNQEKRNKRKVYSYYKTRMYRKS